MKNKAFTLAEILIVLAIMGVIAAIVIPVAFKSSPDEDVLKFKRANQNFYNAVRELTNSESYYANGDLGRRAKGELIDGKHPGDTTYMCETLAQVLNAKEQNCEQYAKENKGSSHVRTQLNVGIQGGHEYQTIEEAKDTADKECLKVAENITKAAIITKDGVSYYQGAVDNVFGVSYEDSNIAFGLDCYETLKNSKNKDKICKSRYFPGPDDEYQSIVTDEKMGRLYAIFCMDIDGLNNGNPPFGYGMRADGKLLTGNLADEWLNKDIKKK